MLWNSFPDFYTIKGNKPLFASVLMVGRTESFSCLDIISSLLLNKEVILIGSIPFDKFHMNLPIVNS